VNDDRTHHSPDDDLYARLAEPFHETFWDNRGGIDLEYVTGEQVTSRLNETLGFLNWSFRVVEHGIHPEADECWVMGELTATIDGQTIVRQQFGSQKVKRSRSSGAPLDIGFDLKGAATDCLKKCATLIGVGLWLSEKTAGPDGKPIPKGRPERKTRPARPSVDARLRAMAADAPSSAPAARPVSSEGEPSRPVLLPPAAPARAAEAKERTAVHCEAEGCGVAVWPDREIRLKKKTITGEELLGKARAEFQKPMCLKCFESAWAARPHPNVAVNG
jgi:hypothetical protein